MFGGRRGGDGVFEQIVVKLSAIDAEQLHIRPNTGFVGGEVVGVSNTGAQVTAGQLGFNNRRDRDDFGVVRVGVNYKFGTY